MEDFQVLGNKPWHDSWRCGEFAARPPLDVDGMGAFWSVRDTSWNERIALTDAGAIMWHWDCGGNPAALLLWSNAYPTEVLLPNGNIVAGKPNDFVLIDNGVCKHRVPQAYIRDVKSRIAKPRKFMRVAVMHKPTQYEIDRWRDALK